MLWSHAVGGQLWRIQRELKPSIAQTRTTHTGKWTAESGSLYEPTVFYCLNKNNWSSCRCRFLWCRSDGDSARRLGDLLSCRLSLFDLPVALCESCLSRFFSFFSSFRAAFASDFACNATKWSNCTLGSTTGLLHTDEHNTICLQQCRL